MHLTTLVPIAITLFLFFFLFLFACALVLAWRAISGGERKKETTINSTTPRAVIISPGGRRAADHSPRSRRLIGTNDQPLLLTDWRWSTRSEEPPFPL